MSEVLGDIEFLMVIAGRKQRESLLDALAESGGRLFSIVYGEGSVKASYLIDAFGFAPEETKVVITCLLPKRRSEEAIRMLTERFNFDKPNTGIAFTVPIDKLSF